MKFIYWYFVHKLHAQIAIHRISEKASSKEHFIIIYMNIVIYIEF